MHDTLHSDDNGALWQQGARGAVQAWCIQSLQSSCADSSSGGLPPLHRCTATPRASATACQPIVHHGSDMSSTTTLTASSSSSAGGASDGAVQHGHAVQGVLPVSHQLVPSWGGSTPDDIPRSDMSMGSTSHGGEYPAESVQWQVAQLISLLAAYMPELKPCINGVSGYNSHGGAPEWGPHHAPQSPSAASGASLVIGSPQLQHMPRYHMRDGRSEPSSAAGSGADPAFQHLLATVQMGLQRLAQSAQLQHVQSQLQAADTVGLPQLPHSAAQQEHAKLAPPTLTSFANNAQRTQPHSTGGSNIYMHELADAGAEDQPWVSEFSLNSLALSSSMIPAPPTAPLVPRCSESSELTSPYSNAGVEPKPAAASHGEQSQHLPSWLAACGVLPVPAPAAAPALQLSSGTTMLGSADSSSIAAESPALVGAQFMAHLARLDAEVERLQGIMVHMALLVEELVLEGLVGAPSTAGLVQEMVAVQEQLRESRGGQRVEAREVQVWSAAETGLEDVEGAGTVPAMMGEHDMGVQAQAAQLVAMVQGRRPPRQSSEEGEGQQVEEWVEVKIVEGQQDAVKCGIESSRGTGTLLPAAVSDDDVNCQHQRQVVGSAEGQGGAGGDVNEGAHAAVGQADGFWRVSNWQSDLLSSAGAPAGSDVSQACGMDASRPRAPATRRTTASSNDTFLLHLPPHAISVDADAMCLGSAGSMGSCSEGGSISGMGAPATSRMQHLEERIKRLSLGGTAIMARAQSMLAARRRITCN